MWLGAGRVDGVMRGGAGGHLLHRESDGMIEGFGMDRVENAILMLANAGRNGVGKRDQLHAAKTVRGMALEGPALCRQLISSG